MKKWIIEGIFFGLFLFGLNAVLDYKTVFHSEWYRMLLGLLIYLAGGLAYGYTMKFLRKKYPGRFSL